MAMTISNEKYRIEKDTVGTCNVPKDAYYGVHSMRAYENFQITGRKMDPEIIKSIAEIKKACVITNNEVGLIDEKVKNAQKIKAELFFPNIKYQVNNIIGSSSGFKFFYNFEEKRKSKYDLFNYITHSAKRFNLLEKYQLEQLAGNLM